MSQAHSTIFHQESNLTCTPFIVTRVKKPNTTQTEKFEMKPNEKTERKTAETSETDH